MVSKLLQNESFKTAASICSIILMFVLVFSLFTSSCNSENYGVEVRHAKGEGEVGITIEAANFSVPVDVSFGVEMVETKPCTVVRVTVAGFTAKGTANTTEPVCVEKFGAIGKIRLLQAPQVDPTSASETEENADE